MSKKQKPAGYPGHGKSKIMKKLAKVKAKDVAIPTPASWYEIPFGVGKSVIMLDTLNTPFVQNVRAKGTVYAAGIFWDGQLDDMCRSFHTLRDAAVDGSKEALQIDELLHRVIEVRCQLDTMKKEQDQ